MSTPTSAADAVDVAEFRRVVGRFATGVTVVTTTDDGLDHAMTANSFASVSLEPALVLVCVEHETRFHEAVRSSGVWAVNVLPAAARRHAVWFATRGRPLVGQFEQVPHHRAASGVLLLDETLTALECRTTQVLPAGDHDVLIGAVTALHPVVDGDPLLYWASAYHRLPLDAG